MLEVGITSLRTAGQTTPPLALSHRNPPLHAELLGLWHHSKLVAQSAERIAAEGGVVDPDKAYVAGLLHDVLALADKLGSTANLAALFKDKEQIEARRLAQAWKIPSYAIESIETRGVGFRCVGPVATTVAAAHSQIAPPAGHS